MWKRVKDGNGMVSKTPNGNGMVSKIPLDVNGAVAPTQPTVTDEINMAKDHNGNSKDVQNITQTQV